MKGTRFEKDRQTLAAIAKHTVAKHSKAKLSIQKCTEVYSNSVALWPLKVNMGMTPNIKFVPYLQSQDSSIWVEHGRTQRTFRGLQLLELLELH